MCAAITRQNLTPREQEIAALVREGLTNKQIARALGIAEGTVKLQLHNAFTKLGISRRTQLIVSMAPGSPKPEAPLN